MKANAILAVAIATLAIAVPTAAAGNAAPDWFERAALAAERDGDTGTVYVDAFERAGSSITRAEVASAPDWLERAAIAASGSYLDAYERPGISALGTTVGSSTITADSGSSFDWMQLGIAFLLGLALALALVAAARLRPGRPAMP